MNEDIYSADARTNIYAAAARSKKVAALVTYFHEHGFTAQEIGRLDEAGWNLAAHIAGVKRPSEESKRLAVEQLARVEADQRAESNWEDSQEYGGNRTPERE